MHHIERLLDVTDPEHDTDMTCVYGYKTDKALPHCTHVSALFLTLHQIM